MCVCVCMCMCMCVCVCVCMCVCVCVCTSSMSDMLLLASESVCSLFSESSRSMRATLLLERLRSRRFTRV